MNRRDYLRSLAIGSVGFSVSPFESLTKGTSQENTDTLPAGKLKGDEIYPAAGYGTTTFLVADAAVIRRLENQLPSGFIPLPLQTLNADELVGRLAEGNALVWLGEPGNLPPALSVGGYVISDDELDIGVKSDSPILWPHLPLTRAKVMGAYIAPPKGMPYHNVDEEIRADFLPIWEAKDRFGNVVGYPAVYMNYFAPSLALGRFEGCECFFFFVHEPLKLMDEQQWKSILDQLDRKRRSFLQVTDFNTNYTAFYKKERVQLRVRLRNRNQRAVSVQFRFSIRYPDATDFQPLGLLRRVPEGRSSTEAIFDFVPRFQPGLCEVRLEVLQDVSKAELLAVDGNLEVIEVRYLAFKLAADQVNTSVNHEIVGPSFKIDGEEAFWAGTHYYPSSSWWEWVWRDYRPLKAEEDLAAIRKAGYRIIRVWINPVIDEQVLRSIDVAIEQAARNGIVVILTLFTQWVRQMGFQRDSGEQVLFDFRHPRDFNLISVSLRNLDLQREFISILASRWKNAGNLIYNLSNEVYIKDPDTSQMDKEVQDWEEVTMSRGTLRDSLLYKRWANVMTAVLRKAGSDQLVLPGYVFSTVDGGDVNVANADAPMVPWHNYYPAEHAGLKLQYLDPISFNKPILLEEFGYGEWNPTERYDGTAHYALAGGAAGAVSYEWGLSWLSKESCYWPLPLRETLVDDPDPRWFAPFADMARLMSDKGVGMCPTPSGTGYGSIYHGTPFPASAAVALGRLGLFGAGLQRVAAPETAYVVIPKAQLQAINTLDDTFRKLWENHVLFGVWQEDQLALLPDKVQVLICPHALGPEGTAVIERLRASGVSVFTDDTWVSSQLLDRVSVEAGGEGIRVVMRRTAKGMLLTAAVEQPVDQAVLAYSYEKVGMGLTDFGVVHLTKSGIPLVEGTRKIYIGKRQFCDVESGRAIFATEQPDLLKAATVKLMVTQPTRITFQRTISQLCISDGFGHEQPIQGGFKGNVLTVDDQLARYVILVKFGKGRMG
ncbi:cellulase family glycosylhydrolase [Parapedobacter defluvii]|uniref:cellulase family glycosylhydrolase n=1 Tax=Parapedobacter defluvii TaxID=2045106 RepID=UPI00333E9339